MTRSDYTPPTFTDVPQSQWGSPPAGAVALDAAHVNAMAQAIGNSARQGDLPANPKSYGAKGDGARVADASITSGSNQLTTPSHSFVGTDVGKLVTVAGAGASGATLTATISSVASGAAILSTAASTTVSGRVAAWGSDDTAALQAFLSAGLTEGYIPPGVYLVTAGLQQPKSMSVTLATEAIIQAAASMTVLWDAAPAFERAKSITGGRFDCADLATTGVYLHSFGKFFLSDVKVTNALGDAVIIGDPAINAAYGCLIKNLYIWRESTSAVPAGSRGLWLRTSTDNDIIGCEVVGSDIGLKVDTGDNQITHAHVWGWGNTTSAFPTTCFEDNSTGNIWVSCMADTPSAYGYRLATSFARGAFIGCRAFLNAQGTNNGPAAVQIDNGNPFGTFQGFIVVGNDASHNWHYDFSGGIGHLEIRGLITNFVSVNNAKTGNQPRNIKTTATSYGVTVSDEFIIATTAGVTITLPSGSFGSYKYTVKNTAGAAITVNASTGTVAGAASQSLAAGASASYVNDGTNWISV